MQDMHRDVYDIHHLSIIDWRATFDGKRHWWHFASSHAAYQAYTDSIVCHYEILSGMLAATFLIKYRSLLDLNCQGMWHWYSPLQERHVICQSFVFLT